MNDALEKGAKATAEIDDVSLAFDDAVDDAAAEEEQGTGKNVISPEKRKLMEDAKKMAAPGWR